MAMTEGPLGPYRVLDLADDKGAMCGKMFADLGADVIMVEPPEGSSTRRIPPFLDDEPGIERGLYHLSYAAGKRSVTLDLHDADDRERFLRLVDTADFLVESYPLGYLEGLGLGYEILAERNPRLIHASITPFGDKGPAAHWKAADIVTWAAGGMMFLTGHPGRPPLQISLPQAGLHAGAEAAVSSMLAHLERERTGLGQRIVIDMQACVAWTLLNETGFPILHGDFMRRSGTTIGSRDVARKTVFRCADGYVTLVLSGADYALHTARELVRWMDEEGAAKDWVKAIDFSDWTATRFTTRATPELMQEVWDCEAEVERFLQRHTRRAIYKEALRRNLLIAPVATVEDIATDEQLEARQYFRQVEFPALGRELTLPGPFAQLSASPGGPPRPSPTLGEHNDVVLKEVAP